MYVSEEKWFQGFVTTYMRKYLSNTQTSIHLFTNLRASDIFTQTFWIGRSQWKLENLPSQDIMDATKLILAELQQFKLNLNQDQKISIMSHTAHRLSLGNQIEKLAAQAIIKCL